MSYNLKQANKNERFLDHLRQFGLLSPTEYEFLQAKNTNNDEKALMFNLSEFLQTRNASEFYDISRRMYDSWSSFDSQHKINQDGPVHLEEYNLKDINAKNGYNPNQIKPEVADQYAQIQQNFGNRQTPSHSGLPSNGTNQKLRQGYEVHQNGTEEQAIHNPVPEKYPSRPENLPPNPLAEKELLEKAEHNLKLFNAGLEKLQRLLLQRAFIGFRAIIVRALLVGQNYSRASKQSNGSPHKYSSPKQNSNRNGTQVIEERGRSHQKESRNRSGEFKSAIKQDDQEATQNNDAEFQGSRFDRLYEDKFLQDQNKRLRQELHEFVRMKDCTFSPQINSSKDQPQEDGRKSVFDRLIQHKVPKAAVIHRSHESRQMDGVTFAPDIKISQSISVHQADTDQNNEKKANAAERLYQDAELKQKVLKMKMEYIREQELKDCTFSPQLISPKSLKKRSQEGNNGSRSPAVERLYQDSLTRKQNHMMKLAEKEQNHSQKYTFKPQIFTKGYRGPERSPSNSKSTEFQLTQNSEETSTKQSQGTKKWQNDAPNENNKQVDPFERLYSFAKKKQEVMFSREDEIYKRDSMRNPNISNPRDKSNTSMRDSGLSRSRSAKTNSTTQARAGLREKSEQASEQESRFLERLEESNLKRKEKISQLQDKFMKEQGITFKPKTLLNRIGANSTKSKNDDRSLDNLYVSSNDSLFEMRSGAINRSHDISKFLNNSAIFDYRHQISPANTDSKWMSRKQH